MCRVKREVFKEAELWGITEEKYNHLREALKMFSEIEYVSHKTLHMHCVFLKPKCILESIRDIA